MKIQPEFCQVQGALSIINGKMEADYFTLSHVRRDYAIWRIKKSPRRYNT